MYICNIFFETSVSVMYIWHKLTSLIVLSYAIITRSDLVEVQQRVVVPRDKSVRVKGGPQHVPFRATHFFLCLVITLLSENRGTSSHFAPADIAHRCWKCSTYTARNAIEISSRDIHSVYRHTTEAYPIILYHIYYGYLSLVKHALWMFMFIMLPDFVSPRGNLINLYPTPSRASRLATTKPHKRYTRLVTAR